MDIKNKSQIVINRRLSRLGRAVCAVVASVTLAGLVSSCASAPKPIAGERNTNALRSETLGKRDLITINSLQIAPLSVSAGLQVDTGDLKRFYQALSDAFSAESGIDVQSSVSGSKSKGTADATLKAEVTKYAKDNSSALGASKAALFAVNYSIVRHSDQKEIWASSYFSTEQPDSVNLIEVTRRIARDKGTRLPTIQELEVEAAHSAAVDFASRREQQYIIK